MAKNAKNTKSVDNVHTVVDGEKELNLSIHRHIPTVRIDRGAVMQLFGLVENPATKKLAFYNGDTLVDITAKNSAKWAKMPDGWNVGNRPITPSHVEELLQTMIDGEYHRWAGNMLVIADNPHRDDASKSMCNSQHTTSAVAVYISEHDPKYWIELLLIDDFGDDVVDTLDNSRQRTTSDAISRRGLVNNPKDAKTVQSVVRFLQFRYELSTSPVGAKDKINLIKAVHSLQNDERYKPIVNVLTALQSRDGVAKGTKFAKGSKNRFTKKFKLGEEKGYPAFGLPYVWWSLAGTILVNGMNATADEFADWCHKLCFGDDKSLNLVESALKEFLIKHGQRGIVAGTSNPGTLGHWEACQCLLIAYDLVNRERLPKVAPDFPGVIAEHTHREQVMAKKEKREMPKTLGMLWQNAGNDVPGKLEDLELYPYVDEEIDDDDDEEDTDDSSEIDDDSDE